MTDNNSWISTCTDEEYDAWVASPEYAAIEEEGRTAYNKWYCNKPFEKCPYMDGTKEELAWSEGWQKEKGH